MFSCTDYLQCKKKLLVEYYFVIFRNIVLFRIIYINERDTERVLLDIIINHLLRANLTLCLSTCSVNSSFNQTSFSII